MIWLAVAWIALGLATGWLTSRVKYGGLFDWFMSMLFPPVALLMVLWEWSEIRTGIATRRAYKLAKRERAREEREQRLEDQFEDDYRETLRLIEWKPRALTPIELLERDLADAELLADNGVSYLQP